MIICFIDWRFWAGFDEYFYNVFFIMGDYGFELGQIRLLIRMFDSGLKLNSRLPLFIYVLLECYYPFLFTNVNGYFISGKPFFWNCLRFWFTKIRLSWNRSIIIKDEILLLKSNIFILLYHPIYKIILIYKP